MVTPSDALVINTSEYQRVLSKALSYTSDKNAIVTICIKPSRPETGYGYIATAEPTSVDEIYKVEAFKEKPNLETAEQYLAAGNYYWNAGIFVWNIDTISKAIRTFQPNLASIMDEMAPSFYTEQEKEVVDKLFPTCEKISIDYAVMEKSKEIYTLPAEFGWSDLGSWAVSVPYSHKMRLAMPRLARTSACMNARTACFMQPMKKGGSSRLGWLYRSREEWTTACLFFERGTEN